MYTSYRKAQSDSINFGAMSSLKKRPLLEEEYEMEKMYSNATHFFNNARKSLEMINEKTLSTSRPYIKPKVRCFSLEKSVNLSERREEREQRLFFSHNKDHEDEREEEIKINRRLFADEKQTKKETPKKMKEFKSSMISKVKDNHKKKNTKNSDEEKYSGIIKAEKVLSPRIKKKEKGILYPNKLSKPVNPNPKPVPKKITKNYFYEKDQLKTERKKNCLKIVQNKLSNDHRTEIINNYYINYNQGHATKRNEIQQKVIRINPPNKHNYANKNKPKTSQIYHPKTIKKSNLQISTSRNESSFTTPIDHNYIYTSPVKFNKQNKQNNIPKYRYIKVIIPKKAYK